MSLKGQATACGNVNDHQKLVGRINSCDVLTLSAYGIAVKNGFKGTEEEWLLSLRGDDGTSIDKIEIKEV